MNKLMLVILIVTTFYVTISVSSPIISNNEEATDQELEVAAIEALVSAFISNIQQEELAKVAGVNPAKFRCTKSSPTDAAVWSNTNPEVALTHIFCGQIQKGKAEGFHSRPKNEDPVCAKAKDKVSELQTFPLECYKKIEVLQFNKGTAKWIARKPDTYCFFPHQWDIAKTTNILVNIYKRCQTQRDSDKICYKKYKHPKVGSFGIVIFITSVGGHEAINSAFPVLDKMTMPCKKLCTG